MTAQPVDPYPTGYGTPRRRVRVRVVPDWRTVSIGTPTEVEARAALHRALRGFDDDPSDDHLTEVARTLNNWRNAR